MNPELGNNRGERVTLDQTPLGFLRPAQVAMIDEALAAVGDFGEVHLIVENRRLRFVVTQRSADVLKWQPGSLAANRDRPHRATSAISHGRDDS
jgi:hypothetical protein